MDLKHHNQQRLQQKYLYHDVVLLSISALALYYFDPIGGWLDRLFITPWIAPQGFFPYQQNWYLRDIQHDLFKKILIGCYSVFLILWLISFRSPRFAAQRWHYAYMFFGAALSTAVIGLLKAFSVHDCPWNMLQSSPQGWVWHLQGIKGQCFPGGHASTGFAMMTGYFVYRLQQPKRAQFFLWLGLALGFMLGWGQMMRGAHFLSHNLWSAWIIYALHSGLQMSDMCWRYFSRIGRLASIGQKSILNKKNH
ncbi:phosphatase PAP2 family protein [Acinetobacter larvae]|uniref:Phosphatidic acid phosphatase type 2/haloperoxidase domain-containing protein n=1 Tax=Acinetobacter larvae TaxID=1789224 RepID=A0A1B2M1J2_9GAMM|nr:phosphatase PAP2 family protein [Acinetobacter larvae]AOA59067.1 hypothetical protein BFG52_12370 [Acinetobacter larvae]